MTNYQLLGGNIWVFIVVEGKLGGRLFLVHEEELSLRRDPCPNGEGGFLWNTGGSISVVWPAANSGLEGGAMGVVDIYDIIEVCCVGWITLELVSTVDCSVAVLEVSKALPKPSLVPHPYHFCCIYMCTVQIYLSFIYSFYSRVLFYLVFVPLFQQLSIIYNTFFWLVVEHIRRSCKASDRTRGDATIAWTSTNRNRWDNGTD